MVIEEFISIGIPYLYSQSVGTEGSDDKILVLDVKGNVYNK